MLELLTHISAIIALWIAIYGIDSWRREHLGRKRTDTVEEALALMYEAADAIEFIRHPVSFESEHGDIERGPGESESSWQARRNANVAFVRYDHYKEQFGRLQALKYRVMAQLGRGKAKPIVEIASVVNEILGAAKTLSRLWPQTSFNSNEQLEKHQKRVERYENIFWNTFSDDDEIKKRVEAAISDMEKTTEEVVSGAGSLYGLLNKRISK